MTKRKREEESSKSSKKITSYFSKKNDDDVEEEEEEGEKDSQQQSTPTTRRRRRSRTRSQVSYAESSVDDGASDTEKPAKKLKTTSSSSSKPVKKRPPLKKKKQDDDDDFVLSDNAEDDEEVVLEEEELEEKETIVNNAEDDNASEDDIIVDTPVKKRKATTPKKASTSKKKSTPKEKSIPAKKISASLSSKVSAKIKPKTSTVQKKTDTILNTPSRLYIPNLTFTGMNRPSMADADSVGVVRRGKRTFLTKSRVRDNKKHLIHFMVDPDSFPKYNLGNVKLTTDNIQSISLLPDDHPQKKMHICVNKKPVFHDHSNTRKKKKNETIEQEKTMKVGDHSINVGEASQVNGTLFIANVGGGASIWSAEWCYTDSNDVQYASFCCHPLNSPYNRLNQLYTSPENEEFPMDGMIQIWSMGSHVTANTKMNSAPIRCHTVIKHKRGFVWKLKWMPAFVSNNDQDDNILGVFAAAFSDGSLVIQVVPKLSDPPLGQVNTIILSDEHVYIIPDTQLQPKPITAVAWSNDVRFLAVGCDDGTLVTWKVNQNREHGPFLTKIGMVQAHHCKSSSRIRSIAWSSLDVSLFATVADDGTQRFWDVRDLWQAHGISIVGRHWTTDIAYPVNVNGSIAVCAEGISKQWDAKEDVFTIIVDHGEPIWAVSVVSTRAAFAHCTSTGRIVLIALEEDALTKGKRKSVVSIDCDLIYSSMVEPETSSSTTAGTDASRVLCLSFPCNTKYNPVARDPTPNTKTSKKKTASKSKKKTKKSRDDDDSEEDVEEEENNNENDDESQSNATGQAEEKNVTCVINKKIPDRRMAIHCLNFHPSRHKQLRNWLITGGQYGYAVIMRIPELY
jgi:WD40 repeat protein